MAKASIGVDLAATAQGRGRSAVTMLDGHPVVKTLMLWLNPISGVITNARSGLLGRSPVDWHALVISLLMSVVIFVLGLCYFRNTERHFADIV